jgi:hypothetical protein
MEDDGSDPYQRLRSAIALNASLPKTRSLERSVDLLFKANIFHWPQVGWHARNLFLNCDGMEKFRAGHSGGRDLQRAI